MIFVLDFPFIKDIIIGNKDDSFTIVCIQEKQKHI